MLKKDACPVKQRPYCYSPILPAKRSDRNWQASVRRCFVTPVFNLDCCSSPLVVVAKLGGRSHLPVNNNHVNEQSVIPLLPFPTVDDLVSKLGNSYAIGMTGSISGFSSARVMGDSNPNHSDFLSEACESGRVRRNVWLLVQDGFSPWC